MVDVTSPPAGEGGDRVEPIGIEIEMQRSYLDYAMSVIVGRALPDVRDGLKPVHRRVLYAMYDGGYRPDRGYFKCARVVGEVMGNYHPHGDSAIYDTLVRLAQTWSMRMPLVDGNGNFGSPGNDPAAAMRYTECRLTPLAMEMLRDIDEDTVDFASNYDGRSQEPAVLPARFPNLLVNGAAGIAVGMATNIPPHNLSEVAAGVQWLLDNPAATDVELLDALLARVQGPDFPTGALIVGRAGIEEAYRTGRGSVTMRAVVEVEENARGQQQLVVTELPYQVNPDNLALKIAELVKEGRLTGIANVQDETSARVGQRLVIVLKRDAVAKVVLNNLYKHTQLQDTFGCNMLALVDGVPRTLSLDRFVRHWVDHQIEVIQRRTRYRLRKAEERAHILRGLLKALDALDEVIALIRASDTVEAARTGLMGLLEIDEVQATAILDMQLRRLAALERQRITDEYDELMARIADYTDILARPERQRAIISEELGEIVGKFGRSADGERRTRIIPSEGEVNVEDLIAEEDVVVTITRGGYAKRTRTDLYRSQRRGGKGVRGTELRQDDIVEHFFVTTTHHWILFFTTQGRVYRAKAYELAEAGRTARGQHMANVLGFQPDEQIAQVLALRDYEQAPYLVLATRNGVVKKSRLAEFDSNRSGGVIAINLREGDEVISAALVGPQDDLLLVSQHAKSARFHADDTTLRPMGRPTGGVLGMTLAADDRLLAMEVVRAAAAPGASAPAADGAGDGAVAGDDETQYVLVATSNGMAKRTPVDQYEAKGRNIQGVYTAELTGDAVLVGALVVRPGEEVFAIRTDGGTIRTSADEVRITSRKTKGVKLLDLPDGVGLQAIARNAEQADTLDGDDELVDGEPVEGEPVEVVPVEGVRVEGEPVDGESGDAGRDEVGGDEESER